MRENRFRLNGRVLFIPFTLICFALTAAEAPHNPLVPLAPADLIKFLPTTPTGWELKQSNAKNFFVEWLCSQATREFQRIPPPSVSGAATPAPPQVTVLKLIDTGYFPGFNGPFANFQVGKYGAFESLMINGMRARRSKLNANREVLQVSVRGRFIVSVEVQNQPPNSADGWLRLVDFQRISAITDTSGNQLPKPIVITSIDELTPSKNSTSKLFWGGSPIPAPSPGQ